MREILRESSYQVILSYTFLVVVLLFVRFYKLDRGKEIFIATLRMTVQLILAGFILLEIFQYPSPWLTIVTLAVMEAFCVYTVFSRFKGQLFPAIKRVIIFSIVAGTTVSIFFFILVILKASPWYDPVKFIPISGMLIGNSMTGITLGVKSLVEGMGKEKQFVEERLILGATPYMASKEVIRNAFDTAIMPTVNSMLGIGIVFLPGMMTGQILAGEIPITAVSYQIAIMLGILGSVNFTAILLLLLGYRTFFNDKEQLI